VRVDDELASDTEALARAEDESLNETVKPALAEAVQRQPAALSLCGFVSA
jgi:predicted transcriptional regulator